MRERVPAERTFLHLSLRPVDERELGPSTGGLWSAFGWTMVVLAGTSAVLMIVFLIAFFGQPGAGA